MKSPLKSALVLGAISFWLGAVAASGQTQRSSEEAVSPVSKANEAKTAAGEGRNNILRCQRV